MTARVRTVLVLLALAVALALSEAPMAVAPVRAQEPGAETTEARQDLPGIIPRPNSGVAPQRSGDRGGWAQLLLLGILVAAVAVVFVVLFRSARRTTRAKQPPT